MITSYVTGHVFEIGAGLFLLAAFLLSWLFIPKWLNGWRYAVSRSAHVRVTRDDNAVWGELGDYDDAFQRALDDELADTYAAPCEDDDCSQMVHSRPLYAPDDLDAMVASTPPSRSWATAPNVAAGNWQPRSQVPLPNLPPWQLEVMAATYRYLDGDPEDFPERLRPAPEPAGDELAEEGSTTLGRLLSQRLRQLLRRTPKNLPVAADAAVPAAAPHVLAAGDGEPIEGVVIDVPLPEYNSEGWLALKASIDAEFEEEYRKLATYWSHQLEPAA